MPCKKNNKIQTGHVSLQKKKKHERKKPDVVICITPMGNKAFLLAVQWNAAKGNYLNSGGRRSLSAVRRFSFGSNPISLSLMALDLFRCFIR